MKKFLLVHWVEMAEILRDMDGYLQNVTNWVRCYDWERGEAECTNWVTTTAEYCDQFEYVMVWLVTETTRLDKFLEIVRGVKRAKVIAYADGPVGWQFHPFPIEEKEKYINILRGADYVFWYGRPESQSYWDSMVGNRTYCVERPYPVTEWRKRYHPIDIPWGHFKEDAILIEKENKILLAKGFKNVNEERNVYSSLAAASNIQASFPDYSVLLHTATPLKPEKAISVYRNFFGLRDVDQQSVKPWHEYMEEAATCKVAIHLDVLETRGQFALDCATFGTPLVCSGSVAGAKLFPYTYISYPRDIEKATHKAMRLIEDASFRNNVIKYAWNKVKEYSFTTTRKKLNYILENAQCPL